MPQYMVLRPRGAYCTTWHPGDMVQVAAFPLISHNSQLSQEGSGDSLFSHLSDAESIGSNGERRQEREHSALYPYFVITGYFDFGFLPVKVGAVSPTRVVSGMAETDALQTGRMHHLPEYGVWNKPSHYTQHNLTEVGPPPFSQLSLSLID